MAGYRKFIIALAAILSATGLRAFSLIPPEVYASVMQWTICTYLTAQALQNTGVKLTTTATKGATND